MLTDDESAELADLRRRAWGTDPDIVDDPVALARLEELESKARPVVEGRSAMEEPTPEPRPSADDADDAQWPANEGEARDDPGAGFDPAVKARPRRRHPILIAGGTLALLLIATTVGIFVIGRPAPVASPSATPPLASALPPLSCGSGWGADITESTPAGHPAWSHALDVVMPATVVVPSQGHRWLGVWADMDIEARTIADVTIVSPASARLFYSDVRTWREPPSPDQIIANRAQSVTLPFCRDRDSYPGYILSPTPACVTVEFTVDGDTHYTAQTPVGIDQGARCPGP